MKTDSKMTPVCLTIAGVDPSGGAGILADIKTFSAFGCFGTAAVTSLTFQNTQGVFGAIHQTAESVRNQTRPILDDFKISALKTGMLPSKEVIEEIAALVAENDLGNFVVDPVVRSTSGFDLIDDAALRSLIEQLFPLSAVVTPNIPEAERISGLKIESEGDFEKVARKIQSLGARNVLLKGGHLPISDLGLGISDSERDVSKIKDQRSKIKDQRSKVAKDYLFCGDDLHIFEGEYHETTATHGTGCTLAAAITANLALGKSLVEAVGIAKRFVNEAIRTAPDIGHGHSPINHLLFDFKF
jgi:hydroxymethylpyrimidine kinase/phosphomethylpyrimidine kinase